MKHPMFINGEWISAASDGEEIAVYNPATEELLATVPNGSTADTGRAVQAAKTAFREWRWVPAGERAAMLQSAANKLRADFDTVVKLLTLEYYAGLIRDLP